MKKVRVLSIDGGGIRGVIPATIMTYVEQKLIEITGNSNARIADYFDFIAGTSTGAMLSCFYLAPNDTNNGPSAKYTAQDALDIYVNKGYDIFNASKNNGWFGLRQLVNATKYSPKAIEKIFKEVFGEMKMHDLLKPCVIATYNMAQKSSYFFNNNIPHLADRQEFYIKDVLRSTSAAPTYFPPAHVTNLKTNEKMVNIDGGVFANNPTMNAYALCSDSSFEQVENPDASQLLVLSLGTGGGQFNLPNLNTNWSVLKWAEAIPNIMMDGSIDAVDYQMRNLYFTLEKQHQFNYKRIDVPKDKRNYAADMADASKTNIDALKAAGQATLEAALKGDQHSHGLDKFIQLLVDNAPEQVTAKAATVSNHTNG